MRQSVSKIANNRKPLVAGFIATLVIVSAVTWLFSRPAIDIDDLPPSATGTTVIDLLVLYNRAASDMYNNDAATRIQHMVDVANQVYIDSQVNLTLRLVHTEQVSYDEPFDSETAVEHMTNQTHPAFMDLPALRQQYGADLVTFARPYTDDGYCGLAWVGGLGTNGDFSNPHQRDYGYSLVSIDCGSFVLAHELGHNMGLNHSRKQDETGGTYDYALGYGVDNDFATIMAYGSAFNAKVINRFSSPDLDCITGPCGIEKASKTGADSVYALNQVVPQIADYYATQVESSTWVQSRLDSDGNGLADIILRNQDGQLSYNSMRGSEILSAANLDLPQDSAWQVVGQEDYDGDGKADLLTRNELSGEWHVSLLDGDVIKSQGSLNISKNLDWQAVAGGDYNGDGRGDIVTRHVDGRWYIYFIDGITITGNNQPSLPESDVAHLAARGDFNGDGITDLLMRQTDGAWNMHHIQDGNVKTAAAVALKKSIDWSVVGSADFDGNEVDDVLMRYKDGSWLIYSFDGMEVSTQGFLPLTNDLNWQLASVGDFDGDGTADIMLRNSVYGTWQLYTLQGNEVRTSSDVGLTPDLNWLVPKT